MADYRNNGRGHSQHWPHFDRRGPEYYFEEHPRNRPQRPPYEDQGYRNNRFQDDSDIYEDEFDPREDMDFRPYDDRRDHWPDDEFMYERRHMRPENFIERGMNRLSDMWRGMRGQGPGPLYPEDRNPHYYGRDVHSENRNRGSRQPRRFNRY